MATQNALEALIQQIAKPIAEAVLEELRPQLEGIVRSQVRTQQLAEDRLLRLPEVLEVVGVKATAWFSGIKEGRYPKPIKLGRASAWRMSEIRALVGSPRAKQSQEAA